MFELLETGRALYVLAGICLLGIVTRMMTKNLYKRLVKQSTNLATAKNKSLKELKTRAENAYRMNQGMRDSSIWIERQLCELRFRGLTLSGWGNFSMQLTWLCLLLGGIGAFLSYWYRLDTHYIVMYGGGSVLLAMVTMLFDNGAASGRKEQLVCTLQDYLENVFYPRLSRNFSDGEEDGGEMLHRNGRLSRLSERPMRTVRGGAISERDSVMNRSSSMDRGLLSEQNAEPDHERQEADAEFDHCSDDCGQAVERTAATISGRKLSRKERRQNARAAAENRNISSIRGNGVRSGEIHGGRDGKSDGEIRAVRDAGQENIRDVDYLKRSLEQIAASREKNRPLDENWLKDLGPEEVQLIGDILKQYLG